MKSKPIQSIFALIAAMLLAGCAELLPPVKQESTFAQVITVLKPIDGVSVNVSYQGGIYYHVQVNNSLPSSINLLWDESAFVSTGGQSVRLIRTLDKNKLPTQLLHRQADSPIAPKSQLQADFAGESWIKLAKTGGIPKPKDSLKKARIYLYFSIKGKRVDWQGEVVFVPKKSS